ncbi:LuxR C-terminal-related transcriptional regulator [Sporichthya sp.]|uniref:helix-turn-helix transcriptional regulator n=1 Tax=Sporichthya sp. TaxID=65475 RepID=UPI0025F8946F|nr:LuxR C-terminal-related transcriptional regulator [Sporichthya sp.]
MLSTAQVEIQPELVERISSALTELDALHTELGAARHRLQRLSADLGGVRGDGEASDATAGGTVSTFPATLPTTLTSREFEVLGLLAAGFTNAAIAERLMIADGTAKKHVFRVLRKLGVTNRSEAVAFWFRSGQGAGNPATP